MAGQRVQHSPPALIVAFYDDDTAAIRAKRRLRSQGLRRVASVRAGGGGRTTTLGAASPLLGAVVGAAVGLGVFTAVLTALVVEGASELRALSVGIALIGGGALVGWLLARYQQRGVDQRVLSRYRRWILPGETLLVVTESVARAPGVIAQLRQAEGDQPTLFVLRKAGGVALAQQPVAQPRPERYTVERLRRHGAQLGAAQRTVRALRWRKLLRSHPLWGALAASERALDVVTRELTIAPALGQSLSPAAEWLLDNSYLAKREVRDARRNLSRSLYDALPILRDAAGRRAAGRDPGQPRVNALAHEFVAHTDAEVHVADLVEFLDAYQESSVLTSSELWALPLMVRLALLETLDSLARLVYQRHLEHERADFWAHRLLSASRRDPDRLLLMLAELAREHPDPPPFFADRLVSQLQGEPIALDPIRSWMERKFGAPVSEVIYQEQLRHAADQVTIANAINGLRQLSRVDWRDVYEQVSAVHRILGADPAGAYAHMDFDTRDRYRHCVEEIARRMRTPEGEVAQAAVDLARAAAAGAEGVAPAEEIQRVAQHVGWYLVSDGRRLLERRFGYGPPPGQHLRRWAFRRPARVYVGGVGAVWGLVLAALLARAAGLGVAIPAAVAVGLLAALPVSEVAVQVVNFALTKLLPPRVLPKMHFGDGIPDEWRTLVVVPVLLLSGEDVRENLEQLEVRFLGNQDPNLYYALLADYPDAPQPVMPEDAALLDAVVRGISALNERYGDNRFSLFYRQRQWSATEQAWMGWERKRGKLEELNRWLVSAGGYTTFQHVGDDAPLQHVRFVITLDADTQLPPGAARRLVEVLAHPLNRPRLAPDSRTVVAGYAIVQPRVTTALPSATATRFSRFFTDPTGTDPYTRAVSDPYHDLAGEGSYIGKGIYDVAAFHGVLTGRFPEALLLSHDLVEGAHVRVGLASDVDLFDLFPSSYRVYANRAHRWIRGDWQIADWCLPWVPGGPVARGNASPGRRRRVPNPLSPFNRWKIFDNLRRSLVPAATIGLLILGWLITPGGAGLWTGLAFLVLFLPPLLGTLTWIVAQPLTALNLRQGWRGWYEQSTGWGRACFEAALLPHQALIALDAITRVFWRRWISRRQLLKWQTFSAAHAAAGGQEVWRIGGVSLFAVAVGAAMALLRPAALPAAGPFLILWCVAPGAVAWLNGRRARPAARHLSTADRALLRQVARQTWRYFDALVGPQTNWLPPDNYQVALRREVALRTSPTNIGLGLLATLAAWDFGYLTLDDVLDRGEHTLGTVQRLERFEGHLLNWYDIAALEPLQPRYVSSADSGNLLGSLWALRQGYAEMLSAPVVGPSSLRGLRDTLALLQAALAAAVPPRVLAQVDQWIAMLAALFADPPEQLAEIVRRIKAADAPARELMTALQAAVPSPETSGTTPTTSTATGPDRFVSEPEEATASEAVYWAEQLTGQVSAASAMIDRYLSWVEPLVSQTEDRVRLLGDTTVELHRQALTQAPSLRAIASGEFGPLAPLLAARAIAADLPAALGEWLQTVEGAVSRARWLAGERVARADRLLAQVDDLADEMNMRFLYDPDRKLFAIGHNVTTGRTDTSYYDLLTSEARLGSYVALTRGEVPVEHWIALGRPYGKVGGQRVLLSWSGTMFEYLMPLLLTRSYENSLLDEACRAAVAAQMAYGAARGVPWGISEAAFAAVDSGRTYQYQAFGVPGLGLKRGLEEDLVVAPYATALALPLAPRDATQNLRRLAREGLRGRYGFYESIDYTPSRRPPGGRGTIVYTFMAHHQGMSLLAIDNTLHDGAMQRRFHADARVQAAEALLWERIPVAVPLTEGAAQAPGEQLTRRVPARAEMPVPRFTTPHTPEPRTQLLGNGTYAVMVTNAGGGYSSWRDLAVTRWQPDTTRDAWGTFFYVRDLDEGSVWSSAYQPVRRAPSQYAATFSAGRAEYERRDVGIGTQTEIAVSSEDDAEVRRLTLVNLSRRTRHLEVTSYVELALAAPAADAAHPAFSKLFVQTEALADRPALLAWRKPRAPHDPSIWAMHVVAVPAELEATVQHETDRARFIGRGRSLERPAALDGDLSGSTGAVLDPVFSLRVRLTLEPGHRVQLPFALGAAETREAALDLSEKYADPRASARVFELAWSQAQLETRFLRVSAEAIRRYQQLASYMLYPCARLRAAEREIRANRHGQRRLWAHGISGDLPIMMVRVGSLRDIDLVRDALLAHTYWRLKGFRADLVILAEEAPGYAQPLRDELRKLALTHAQFTGTDQPGGIYVRSAADVDDEDLLVVLSAAHVVLYAARGPLAQQLAQVDQAERSAVPPPLVTGRRPPEEPSAPLPFMELPYFNGLGGFIADGREYAIYLGPGTHTPAPWVNVMANPGFGALVSEAGQGFAWALNSQANRLLPWSNDPVLDPSGDAIYIRDEESGKYWTPTASPIRELDAYRARHGQGYTLFEHNSHAIEQELATFVPVDEHGGAPVRVQRLRLRNQSARPRRLTVTFYADWVLGGVRAITQRHIVTGWHSASRMLLARNSYHPELGGRVAFAGASLPVAAYTADRTEFLGRNGSPAAPAALGRRGLSGRVGAGLDPCAALQVMVELNPGAVEEVTFVLGQAADEPEASALAARYRSPVQVDAVLQTTRDWWDGLLSTIQVETPDLAVNFLLNRWLMYQTLSCRVWGRSAFYQSGGAFGFRDQLQDSMALVYTTPDLTRRQILDAAAHQFEEGDVLHWWHPQSGAGVRTRISDDLLWLPYVTAHYVRCTGDHQILEEVVPFLRGRPLAEGEHEAYFVPDVSSDTGTVLEHCRRAIERGSTAGRHGLPLIGTGDWNDGMNLVGAGGTGESVWLAWFLIDVLNQFADVLAARNAAGGAGSQASVGANAAAMDGAVGTPDGVLADEASRYRERARRIAAAVEASAWDGQWYVRAFFDDGTPLGSRSNDEAKIDSLPQSWAVISGAADPARAAQALEAAGRHLVREDDKLVLLFTPPFEDSPLDPGYVKSYPPGVRENGGQYTHGALWLAMAHARRGDGEGAVRLLRLLNPVEHAREPAEAERYRVEPYVVAADVYALEGHVGQGGWTWYTGSSGWMYRIWLEEVLGFHLRGDHLLLDPVLPTAWPRVGVSYRYGRTPYSISIENPDALGRGVLWITVDGARQPDASVPLRDDGEAHLVVVRLGTQAPAPVPQTRARAGQTP